MYDVIIAGGGPAGLNAAMYAGRSGLKTLLIEKLYTGGQAATTYEIDNYLGFDQGISGADLTIKMEDHARKFGAKILYEDILEIETEGRVKSVRTEKGTYEAKALILCTGAAPRVLGLEDEDRLRGMGVSYCATCDGAFFRGKVVAVAGGGDTACEDALFLARYCEKVYLIHRRDSLRAVKSLQDAVFAESKISLVWDSEVTALHSGIDVLEGITVKNKKTLEEKRLSVSGIFVAIGTAPQSSLVEGKLSLSQGGYIITDENMKTSAEGVYAAGDVREKTLRQVITAAADGAIAAYNASRYIAENI